MKAKLFLLKGNKTKKNEFPICVELVDSNNRKRKQIAVTLQEFWSVADTMVLNTHPNYNLLAPKILDYKSRVFKINYGDYDFASAAALLFVSSNVKHLIFYNAALKFCDDSSTGKLFKTVLNSFNSFAPNMATNKINKSIVEDYMQLLLLKNKPNGVHTYLRKLTTLYNKLGLKDNPFKGVRPRKTVTPKKSLVLDDVIKLNTTRTILNKFDGRNTIDTVNYPRYYWLLMFYLGGIDFVDLAALRYDKHVVNGRIQFKRHKGGTDAFINNKLFPVALELLKIFNCKPYLVPIYKYTDYKSYQKKCNDNLYNRTKDLKLTRKPLSKSARSTFIDRAQQLLVDQRITMEIVGHTDGAVHGIYTDKFPLSVRDTAHEKIINLNCKILFDSSNLV